MRMVRGPRGSVRGQVGMRRIMSRRGGIVGRGRGLAPPKYRGRGVALLNGPRGQPSMRRPAPPPLLPEIARPMRQPGPPAPPLPPRMRPPYPEMGPPRLPPPPSGHMPLRPPRPPPPYAPPAPPHHNSVRPPGLMNHRLPGPPRMLHPGPGLRPPPGPPGPRPMVGGRPPPPRGNLRQPPPRIGPGPGPRLPLPPPGPPGLLRSPPAPPYPPSGPPMRPPPPGMGMRFGRGGIRKNMRGKGRGKTNSIADTEINKPWITEPMKNEILKKHKLHQKAKRTKKMEDWDAFKEQRNRVTTMIREAKLEYIGSHPEEAYLYDEDEEYSCQDEQRYYCDTCDRAFKSEWEQNEHNVQHKTCGLDGCTFTAHPKIIQKHIQMQHATGLIRRLRNLNTPEDISAWIAERKRNYPTRENVERQQERRKEMIERGERLQNDKSRFNNKYNRHRPGGHSNVPDEKSPFLSKSEYWQKKREDWQRRKEQRMKKAEIRNQKKIEPRENDAQQYFKRDWNRNLPPFGGTALYKEAVEEPQVPPTPEQQFSDNEWEGKGDEATPIVPSTALNSALFLLGTYDSDNNSESEESQPIANSSEKSIIHPASKNPQIDTTDNNNSNITLAVDLDVVPEASAVTQERPELESSSCTSELTVLPSPSESLQIVDSTKLTGLDMGELTVPCNHSEESKCDDISKRDVTCDDDKVDDSGPEELPIARESNLGEVQDNSLKINSGGDLCLPDSKVDDSGPEELPIVRESGLREVQDNSLKNSSGGDMCVSVTSQAQQENSLECSEQKKRNRRHHKRKRGNDGEEKTEPVAKRPFTLPHVRRRRLTLLEKLLQKEIRHERNVILQCVRYVVENNFFGIGQKKDIQKVVQPAEDTRKKCDASSTCLESV